MRAASLTGANAGGYVSYANGIVGGFTIANGVAIEKAIGGSGNDTILGNDKGNVLLAGSGDDQITVGNGYDYIDGGYGIDTVNYTNAQSGVSVNLGLTRAQSTGGSGLDTIIGIERLYGSNYSDVLTSDVKGSMLYGVSGNDAFLAAAGTAADVFDGGEGSDLLKYANATSAVTVNLDISTEQSTGGSGYDTIISIERLYGSNHADMLTSSSKGSALYGASGNDVLFASASMMSDVFDGGSGVDTLKYTNASSGVTVNLDVTTQQSTGGSGLDTIINIERLYGSNYADVLISSSQGAALYGGSGNDVFFASSNATSDVFDGGHGSDTLMYTNSISGVRVNLGLTRAQQTDGSGWDAIINIENLHGSMFSDALSGDVSNNELYGESGEDIIDGSLGNDVLIGGSGLDRFVFGSDLNAFTNKDMILDFEEGEIIQLSSKIFTQLNVSGLLMKDNLLCSESGIATDADDFICYNNTNGVLSYDSDGSGSGVAIAFATLGTAIHPTLTASNFVVL